MQLEHLSALDPKTVEILWLEWKAVGAVAAGAETGGQWRIAANAQWVAGDARDHARALLHTALAGARPRPRYSREQIEQILACAALEGDVFHAEAVARTLELDAAALIKFLDSLTDQTADNKAPAHNLAPSPLLASAGGYETARVTLDKHGRRQPTTLHLYRFARPYLRLVWERYGLPPAEQAAQSRAWQKALAEALDLFYYPFGLRIAGKLIRLFRAAGDEARAAEFHRLRLGRMTLDQERWHVDRLLEDQSLDSFTTYRLFDAAFPFLLRWSRERPGEWRVGLGYARRVGARARCLGDEEQEATAWYYAAWQRNNGAETPGYCGQPQYPGRAAASAGRPGRGAAVLRARPGHPRARPRPGAPRYGAEPVVDGGISPGGWSERGSEGILSPRAGSLSEGSWPCPREHARRYRVFRTVRVAKRVRQPGDESAARPGLSGPRRREIGQRLAGGVGVEYVRVEIAAARPNNRS